MEQGQAYWFSVPARVIGKRTLDHIPYEIYLEIFSYLELSHELGTEESQLILSNMARVCRLFYDIAVPSLYRSICLTGSLEEFEEKTPRALTRFCVMLKKEEAPAPDLAKHVRICRLRNWSHCQVKPSIQTAMLNIYLQSARRMPNIETLVLQDVLLTADVCKTIAKLKHLKALQFVDSPRHPSDAQSYYSRLSSAPLTFLSIDYAVQVPNNFTFRSLTTLHVDDFTYALLNKLSLEKPPLKEVRIELLSYNGIMQVLEGIATLTHLHISNSSGAILSGLRSVYKPSTTSFPSLVSLSCPPELVGWFRDRRLMSLEIFGPCPDLASKISSLSFLNHISAPVATFRQLQAVTSFPQLKSLTLFVDNEWTNPLRDTMVDYLCSQDHEKKSVVEEVVFSSPVHLYTVYKIDMGSLLDLGGQHDFITSKLVIDFPRVSAVTFHRSIVWVLCTERKTWRPTICPSERPNIKTALENHDEYTFSDYNNCFASLLAS
jgi:hypothetical protein